MIESFITRGSAVYLIVGGEFCDTDFEFLRELFAMFDSKLAQLQSRIEHCSDPDSSGLFDWSNFLAGSGFVACQTYLTSTFGPLGVSKETALSLGPHHSGGRSYATILNAAANFWKHQEEWGLRVLVNRDVDTLGPREWPAGGISTSCSESQVCRENVCSWNGG